MFLLWFHCVNHNRLGHPTRLITEALQQMQFCQSNSPAHGTTWRTFFTGYVISAIPASFM